MGSWLSKLRQRTSAAPSAASETTARVTIRNDTQRPLQLVFEPWCQTYELAPGVGYTIEATSPLSGWLTVEPHGDSITVYAWDGCVARVCDAEQRVIDVLDIRVPDFSESTRSRR